MLNAASPRAGILIPEAKGLFKPETANLTPFFWTVTPPVFFLGKENGGCGAAARTPHIPAPLGRENPPSLGLQRRKEPCYEYFHVKVAANASILGGFSLDPEYRNIIDRAAEEGWRYVGFLPVSQSVNGAILEYDLIFEQEKK